MKQSGHTLILVRHGETQYNAEKIFTGWTDIDMTPKGKNDVAECGKKLREMHFEPDIVYTSYLKRAIRTSWIILDEMDSMHTPVITNWRLNERHYGALQGIRHEEMRSKFGEEQVFAWRRSFSARPPQYDKGDKKNPALDKKYAQIKEPVLGESLKDTIARVMPCWKNEIAPTIKSGKKILISAHGNSLRALIKHLDNIADDEIPKLEIPTAKPLIYELDKNLKPTGHYYLE